MHYSYNGLGRSFNSLWGAMSGCQQLAAAAAARYGETCAMLKEQAFLDEEEDEEDEEKEGQESGDAGRSQGSGVNQDHQETAELYLPPPSFRCVTTFPCYITRSLQDLHRMWRSKMPTGRMAKLRVEWSGQRRAWSTLSRIRLALTRDEVAWLTIL
eukprot:755748-Hanusia_phi.AAC.5